MDRKLTAKLLNRKLRQWCEEIDRDLEAVRYKPGLLKKLRRLFKEIYGASKTCILREKIKEASLPMEKLESTLIKLDAMIHRVASTPSLEKLVKPARIERKGHESNFLGIGGLSCCTYGSPPFLLQRRVAPLYPISSCSTATEIHSSKKPLRRSKSESNLGSPSTDRERREERALSTDLFRKKMERKSSSLKMEAKAKKISIYTPSLGDNWSSSLISFIKSLNNEQEVISVANNLLPLQAINAISGILHDSKEEWKISLLIGGLSGHVFEECIPAFDDSQLTFLCDILSASSEARMKWLDNEFFRIRQWYIDCCNKSASRINAMAKRFREDIDGNLLTSSDMQHIFEMEGTLRLRMKSITDKLFKLIRRVPLHPETHHVLFEGVIKEYRALLIRLTETREYDERPAGCLLPIIFRNVFDRIDLSDEDEAYDAFGNWGLLYGKDYFEAGIFGDITQEQYLRLESKTGNIFTQMKAHLMAVGIKNVSDFKRLLIFNRTMLSSYLQEARTAKALGDLSQQIINGT